MNTTLGVQAPPASSTMHPDSSSKTILVVDDEPLILTVTCEMLEQFGGYRVLAASNSREALLLAARQAEPPHLLILDYQLLNSSLNGVELYDLLHSRDGWQHVPALMVSGNAPLAELRARSLAHLTKPLSLDAFLATVATLVTP